jgi:hypothetical protein
MAINFNVAPYYDDYSDDDNYLRVLFRPGYAVQARELTQLQTILQRQVTRFGDHLFKNGSQVIPGSVNHDSLIHFAKLDNLYINQTVSSYIVQFRNKIITGLTSGVKALVVDTSDCDCIDPTEREISTLYYKIEQTGTDEVTKRFVPGETLVAYAADNTITNNYRLTENQSADIYVNVRSFGDGGTVATTYTNNPQTDVLGYGFAVEVKEGIYYIDGFFIRNPEMHLYVGRFTQNPSFRVGFKVTESVVTPEEQPLLADNAQGTTNFAAPGAHRYKVQLSLVKLALDSTDEIKFIELIRIKNGRVQNIVTKSSYAELEKTMARRTFDESGNYEVKKFKLSAREHLNEDGTGVYPALPQFGDAIEGQTYGDDDKFVIGIDPGKAYVQGFEIEATSTQYIDFRKARENTITGDEGGHIVREDDYPIQTPVGNYILIENVHSFPDLTTFPLVNLYSVARKPPNGSTITDGVPPSSSFKVGTARVNAFQLHSGDYTAGDSTQYKLGLFDIKLDTNPSTFASFEFEKDVKSISLATGSSAIFTADTVESQLVIVGSASVQNNGTTVTGVGSVFTEQVLAGDILYIDGVQVGVVSAVTNNTTITLASSVGASGARSGVVGVGRTIIREPKFNSLVFKSAFSTIKTLRGQDPSGNDTVKSSQHTVRRIISATAATEGSDVVWAFTLASPTEFFQSVQDLENYTLVDSNTKQIVPITSSNLTLDGAQKLLSIGGASLTAGREYKLITSVLQTGATAGEKTKTLVLDQSQIVTGRKNVSELTITLTHADVLRIKDIRVNPGNYDVYVEGNSVSVLDKYVFDDGQRPTHYQQAVLSLKPSIAPPAGAIKITYDYFNHTGTGNYFSVDSYSASIANANNNFDYKDIPSFPVKNSNGVTETVYLHDVIDYRPVISGSNGFTPELPKIGEGFNTSIAYYLPRWDKLVLDSIGRFNVITGTPGRDPVEPRDPIEGMVLASLYIPAYTKTANDVRVFQRDNRRYTMKDIAALERRIQNLEYYVSLTLLETETEAFPIKDNVTGLDRFKNGFIVDQFTGHGIGDVVNIDYRIAVDPQRQELRPMHFTDAVDIVEDIISSDQRFASSYRKEGDIITLPYEEALSIFNPYGTRTIDVNPYKIGAFKGEIALTPEGDNWKDTDRRPDLLVQDDNNFDAIRFMAEALGVTGTQWNAWQTQWTGSSSEAGPAFWSGNTQLQNITTTDTGVESRDGIRTTLTSTINQQDYGDRVVDISFAEYMRARPVVFAARNLKPNTKFYTFFDNEAVSAYSQPANIFTVTRISGATFMRFDVQDVQNRVVATDTTRTYQGQAQPAFQIGDVLSNDLHTPVVIQTINNITDPEGSTQFTLTVNNATGLRVGHHVSLYNLAPGRILNLTRTVTERVNNQTTIRTYNVGTSREINNRTFRIAAVSGTTITLTSLDGSRIRPFTTYDRAAAYAGADGGYLRRLQATGVVIHAGIATATDALGPITQEIHITNIRNGFAIGENLTGSLVFENSARNQVTTVSINGNSTAGTLPVMKNLGDAVRTDSSGSCAGIFNLPNTDTIRFRTGERAFKLTDNVSNSSADFDSVGEATYSSVGVTLSRERTVVNSRQANFVRDRVFESNPVRRVSTSQRVLQVIQPRRGHDPLAQTFVVQSFGGMFITSVDLYFSEAGNRPITVEIRTTDNGVPSSKILPFSEITKSPAEVLISDDGSVATNFKFRSPIYLVDNENYALVVKTDEPGCQVFISELGKNDILTGNVVTNQPLTGSLYLSQNSKEFEINPLLDMKFRLYQAEFDISTIAQVDLKALPPKLMTLPDNPFEITPGSDIIRVRAPRHGFSAGDVVMLEGIPEFIADTLEETRYYGTKSQEFGIPASLLNGGQIVMQGGVDQDSFCFKLQTQDEYINPQTGESQPNILITGEAGTEATVQSILDQFVKGDYGGTGIRCSRQLIVDYLFLKSDNIAPGDTELKFEVQAIDTDGTPSGFQSITENTNFTFNTRKIIRSYENEDVLSAATGLVRPSVSLRAKISSTNVNVSPVIDLQRLSVFAIRNLINSPIESDTNVIGVDNRSLLKANDVTASDIDAEPASGTIGAFHYTNMFGSNRTLPTATTSGSNRTYTITGTTWLWDGSGSSQTAAPWKRLRIGDEIYTTAATPVFIGTITAVASDAFTINTTTPATTLNDQFLVRSKYIFGIGTAFTTETPVGTLLYNTQNQLIGKVAQVTGTDNGYTLGNTLVELESLATASTVAVATDPATSFTIGTPEAKLSFSNSGVNGIISTNIDTADNLLSLAKQGKYIYLSNMISGINGKYLVRTVVTSTDTTVNIGNAEDDVVTITVSPAFTFPAGVTSCTIDMVNDYLYFKGAGFITNTSSAAVAVTGSGTTFPTQLSVGDVITKQSFGGNVFTGGESGTIIGTVALISSNTSLNLSTNPTFSISGVSTDYYIRKSTPNWKIDQLDKFVEDWAPTGTSNYANYITRPLVLSNTADSLKVLFDSSIPQFTDLKVYYKTWTTGADPSTLNYVDTGFTTAANDALDSFSEQSIDIENITPFTNAIIKIVMKSTDPSKVPRIKKLRLIAHS